MGQIEAASRLTRRDALKSAAAFMDFRITNCREANQHLTREYRKGWDLNDIAG